MSILFFVLNFFLLSFAFADSSEVLDLTEKNQSKKGIYFCTRDVEEDISGWSPPVKSDKSWKDYTESVIVVENSDSTKHKYLRHCFVLLAKEISRAGDAGDKLVLEIPHGFSQGYYPIGGDKSKGHVSSEDFWLFDKKARDERTVSCTPLIQEGDKDKKKNSADALLINEDDLYSVWDVLIQAMSDDSKKTPIWDRYTHNCCTVAFESLRKVTNDSDYLLSLSSINKRSFNVFGCGISFDFNDDTFLGYVQGVGRFSKEISKGAVIITVNKLNGLCYEVTSSVNDVKGCSDKLTDTMADKIENPAQDQSISGDNKEEERTIPKHDDL